jgi:hypothetical protein
MPVLPELPPRVTSGTHPPTRGFSGLGPFAKRPSRQASVPLHSGSVRSTFPIVKKLFVIGIISNDQKVVDLSGERFW